MHHQCPVHPPWKKSTADAQSKTTWNGVAGKLKLVNGSYGETDEGDYDYYTKFELSYKGAKVWSKPVASERRVVKVLIPIAV